MDSPATGVWVNVSATAALPSLHLMSHTSSSGPTSSVQDSEREEHRVRENCYEEEPPPLQPPMSLKHIGTGAGSAVIWLLVCLCCFCTHYTPSPDLEHLYQVLSTFFRQGQLVLEPSLPPLSVWAVKVVPSAYLSPAGVGVIGRIMLFTATVVMIARGPMASHSVWTMALVSTIVCMCYCLPGLQEPWTLLQACMSLGECVIAWVVLLAMEIMTGDGSISLQPPLPTWALASGLLEGSLVLAWTLGANVVDAVAGLFLVYASQLRIVISVQGRNFRSEVSRFLSANIKTTPDGLALLKICHGADTDTSRSLGPRHDWLALGHRSNPTLTRARLPRHCRGCLFRLGNC